MPTKFKPTFTHYKILITISELNEKGFYPLPYGVLNILKGNIDDETKNFSYISTYGSLISFQSKKLSRYILMLLRYGYLKKIYDKKTDNLYLKLTDYGEASLLKFSKTHKNGFKKKNGKVKHYIVHIE